MAPHNLRGFIDLLESRGELRRITAPVSADLEITEITDRVCKSPGGGQALLFENVDWPAQIPVLTNAFGSARRMAWALGVEALDDLGARLARLVKPQLPRPLVDKLRRGLEASEVLRYAPPHRPHAPPARRWCAPATMPRWPACPSSAAGPATPAPFITLPAGHHPRPGAAAAATSACTACRSTTSAPPACTGTSTRAAPSTCRARRAGRAAARGRGPGRATRR